MLPGCIDADSSSTKYSNCHQQQLEGSVLQKFFNASASEYFELDISPPCLHKAEATLLSSGGCVVRTYSHRLENIELRNVKISDLIRTSWRKILSALTNDQKEKLLGELKELLRYKSDTCIQAQDASKTLSSNTAVGDQELLWFRSPDLQGFALLRRMALPLQHVEMSDGQECRVLGGTSMIDLLLDLPDIGGIASRFLHERLGELKAAAKRRPGHIMVSKPLWQLYKTIVAKIRRAGYSLSPLMPKSAPEAAIAVPDRVRKYHQTIMQERDRLLKQLQIRKKQDAPAPNMLLNRKIKIPERFVQGKVFITEKEVSIEDFHEQARISQKINKKLKRPFIHDVSRPRLSVAKISKEGLKEVRSIFFDERGALNEAIIPDVDISSKHSFIRFANGGMSRRDSRWQLPLRLHDQRKSIRTRKRVERVLAKYGCIDPTKERLHDLAMLIGGTTDQSLHHDIPRQTVGFLPFDPDERTVKDGGTTEKRELPPLLVELSGWELDRVAYNDAMASIFAPSSVLLGMGDEFKLCVGVQRNQVDFRGCHTGWCRILNGRYDEKFQIIRETKNMIVIEAVPGVVFTGDFQHAGVRNFDRGTLEDKMMERLFDSVAEINRRDGHVLEIVDHFCRFPNLYKICRFHCSIEPIHGALVIPRNAIGFVDCQENPPSEVQETEAPKKPSSKRRRTENAAEQDKIGEKLSSEEQNHVECPLCGESLRSSSIENTNEYLSRHMQACTNGLRGR